MPPKLLMVVTEDWYFWSHRLPIARAARRMGYQVIIATHITGYAEKIRAEGFSILPLELSRGSYSPVEALRIVRTLRRAYRREKPDVVHLVALKSILYGSLAALGKKDLPVVNALAGLGYLAASSSLKARLLRPIV